MLTVSTFGQSMEIVYEFPTMNANPGNVLHYDEPSGTFLIETTHSILFPVTSVGLDTNNDLGLNGPIVDVVSFNDWIWVVGNFYTAFSRGSETQFQESNFYLFTGDEWTDPFPRIGDVEQVFVYKDTLVALGRFETITPNNTSGFVYYDFATTEFRPYTVSNHNLVQKLGTDGNQLYIADLENNRIVVKKLEGRLFQNINLSYEISSVNELHVQGDSLFVSGEIYGPSGEKFYAGLIHNNILHPISTTGPVNKMHWFDNKLWMTGNFSDFPKTRLAYVQNGTVVYPKHQPDNVVFNIHQAGDGLWLTGKFNSIGDTRTHSRAYLIQGDQWNADTLQHTVGHSPLPWSEIPQHTSTTSGFLISSSASNSILAYESGNYSSVEFPSEWFSRKVISDHNNQMYILASTSQGYASYLFKKEGTEWVSQYSHDDAQFDSWTTRQIKVHRDGKIYVASRAYYKSDYFGFYEGDKFTSFKGLKNNRNGYPDNIIVDDFLFLEDEIFVVGTFNQVNNTQVRAAIAVLKDGVFEAVPPPPGLGNYTTMAGYDNNRLYHLNDGLILWSYTKLESIDEYSGLVVPMVDIYDTKTGQWIETPPFTGSALEAFIQDGWLISIGAIKLNDGSFEYAIAWDGEQIVPFKAGVYGDIPQEVVRNDKNEVLIQTLNTNNTNQYNLNLRLFVARFNLPAASGTLFKRSPSLPSPDIQYSIYPNPFNPTTTLQFTLSQEHSISVEIFSLTGQRIAQVVTSKRFSAGTHQLGVDASTWSSGTYVYRISGNFGLKTGKMVVVK